MARNLWIEQCNGIYDGALKSPFYREHLLLFLHTFYLCKSTLYLIVDKSHTLIDTNAC